jgi:hypothetical protein
MPAIARTPRRLALLLCCALGAGAIYSAVASGSGGPSAGASVARCNGKAFSPTQRGKLLTGKGFLRCTGDVARQRLRTCLEQEVGSRFEIVKCVVKVRRGPGKITARAQRRCGRDVARSFRTRSFLFLRDRSGERARGKAISDTRVYPRRCG